MAGADGEALDVQGAKALAMRYLARREYSRAELTRKLTLRGVDEDIAVGAVESLSEDNLVSDDRFAESFSRQRVERLYGPLRIRAELKQKGVDGRTADLALAPFQDQWPDRVHAWISRHGGADLDRRERARLYRAGIRRGFSHSDVLAAIDRVRDES